MGQALITRRGVPMLAPDVDDVYEQIINYTMLYDSGDECEEITGGWVGGYNWDSNTTAVNGTKNQSDMYFSTGSAARNVHTALGVDNKISLSDFNNMGVHWECTNYIDTSGLIARFVSVKSPMNGNEIVGIDTGADTNEKISILDIADYNESYYFQVDASKNSKNGSAVRAGYVYHIFLTKPDNYKTLCTKAGVAIPSSLESLLADTTSLATIFNNEDAVKFMVAQCTGDFMVSVCNSEDAMSALVNSIAYDYAFANEHWYKFMTMIPTSLSAMDSVAVTVPTMTSDTTPSGEAFVEPAATQYYAWSMFDKDTSTHSGTYYNNRIGKAFPHFFGYVFTSEVELYAFEIDKLNLAGQNGGYSPKDYTIQYSNDGLTYYDSESGIVTGTEGGKYKHVLKTPVRGKYIRLKVDSSYYTLCEWTGIYELQFYGKAVN